MPLPPFHFNEVLAQRFAQVLYKCMEDVGSTKGALYLALRGETGLRLISHYGFPRLVPPSETLAPDHSLMRWVQRERRSFAVNSAQQYEELAFLSQGAETPRFLVSPLYDKGESVGLLVQRDRVRGEQYDLARDEAPTLAICQEIVSAIHEFRYLFLTAPAPEPQDSEVVQDDSPATDEVPTIPVPVPHSDSMLPLSEPKVFNPGEVLEGYLQNAQGEGALAPMSSSGVFINQDQDKGEAPEPASELASEPASEPASGPAPGPVILGSVAQERKPQRPGMFMPEQRTFFWEAANLLSSIVPLAAIALWMDEAEEIRPILAYSRLPLSPQLKQQVLAHATYHIPKAVEKDLRLFTKVEWSDQNPMQGVFKTYLPVVLMEEGGGQDLLLLFRLDEKPFTAPDQQYIQQVARMLGFHLQEGRLHERYHRAFLSVAHRILSTAEGGAPSLRSHSLNTAKLSRNFSVRLDLPTAEVEAVSIAAILHDVGTLLLDPQVLAKPELTQEDLARIRTHPMLASTFLKDFRFPFDVLRIIRHHHERWDGTGYPDGLQGESIPIGSRIISIIEAFEVMSWGSEYRAPRPSREVLDELRNEAGAQFDPTLVAEFIDFLASKTRHDV